MKEMDVHLVRFFHSAIEGEIRTYSRAANKECLMKLKTSHSSQAPTKENEPSSALRCAYAYKYGPCLTSTLIRHFRQLFKNNPLLLQRIVHRGTFAMCCVASGLAVDFVAMVTVLEEMSRRYSDADFRAGKLKIEVVVINTDPGNEAIIGKIAERLPQIVDLSRLSFEIRFLSEDLSKSLTEDVKQALDQSDLVTMIHFLSSVHEDLNSLQVIQEIIPFIRKGGVLFTLDPPDFHLCDTLRRIIDTSEHMKAIYGPLSFDIHRLSFLCMKECLRLYSNYYGWRYCALESKNYVCAFYKRTSSRQSSNSVSFSRLINDPSLFRLPMWHVNNRNIRSFTSPR